MRKVIYLSTVTIFIAFLSLLLLTGCKNTNKADKGKMENMKGMKDMKGMKGMENMKGMKNMKHDDDHGEDHDEADGHSHEDDEMPGHMKHMNDVKKWLEGELGDAYNKPIAKATETQIASGKKIYDRTCFACHGISGKGDGMAAAGLSRKPADFTDPEHASYYSDAGRLYIIKNGIKDSPMVGWGKSLNEKEILDVYAYVESLKGSTESD